MHTDSLPTPDGVTAKPGRTRSALRSRNVVISTHRTSVRLEPAMWDALMEISRREKQTLHGLCTTIALKKDAESSLTAAIRVYVMQYFRVAATEEGHARAGHGEVMGFVRNTLARPPLNGQAHPLNGQTHGQVSAFRKSSW